MTRRAERAAVDPDVILPPAWAFGVLHGGYTDQQSTIAKVRRLIDEDYPIDAYWIDSCFWDITTKGPKGYIDFVGDTAAYPDIPGMWATLHALGVRTGIWVWDRMLRDGNEEAFAKFSDRKLFKEVRVFTEGWHNSTKSSLGGWVDYDNPEAVKLWKECMAPLFSQGLDFLKLDAAAPLPYIRTNFELTQQAGKLTRGRGFVLSHETFPRESGEFKRYPTVWSGDSIPHWKHDEYPDTTRHLYGGLRENVEMIANPGHPNYAYPFLTNDTGGFSSRFGEPTDELFMRWTQFSSFAPIMEVFGSLLFEAQNAPYTFSAAAQENFRHWTHLRMRLFPYIYSHAHLARWAGTKMTRGTADNPRQYLFGDQFFVAPVHAGRVGQMEVRLPEGTWIDYRTGETHSGGRTVTCRAPRDTLPLFVKAGAIIPMRDYARAIELGSNSTLTLDIYPDGVSGFELYEDDGLSNDYLDGGLATTRITCSHSGSATEVKIEAAKGDFDGKLGERIWIPRVHGTGAPSEVTVDGTPLRRVSGADWFELTDQGWYFDSAANVTWAKFAAPTSRDAVCRIAH